MKPWLNQRKTAVASGIPLEPTRIGTVTLILYRSRHTDACHHTERSWLEYIRETLLFAPSWKGPSKTPASPPWWRGPHTITWVNWKDCQDSCGAVTVMSSLQPSALAARIVAVCLVGSTEWEGRKTTMCRYKYFLRSCFFWNECLLAVRGNLMLKRHTF